MTYDCEWRAVGAARAAATLRWRGWDHEFDTQLNRDMFARPRDPGPAAASGGGGAPFIVRSRVDQATGRLLVLRYSQVFAGPVSSEAQGAGNEDGIAHGTTSCFSTLEV